MVTKSFVAKVSRIKNNKNKNYFVHRINIPSEVVEGLELNLDKNEYLFFKAKKAAWYHMLDWSKMNQTWDKLPLDVKQQIQEEGLLEGTNLSIEKVTKQSNLSIEKVTKQSNLHVGTGYVPNDDNGGLRMGAGC